MDSACLALTPLRPKNAKSTFARNRQDVNVFEGMSDPVEILKIIHEPREYDPLVNWIPHPTPVDQLYLGLKASDRERLALFAEDLIGTERHDEAEEVLLCLSAFTDTTLDSCLRRLLACDLFGPSLAFRNAQEDVRDELIARLATEGTHRHQILLALAWIGDATIV